jgi:hypothetical protein
VTVTFGLENWPLRKGLKRLLPRLTRMQTVPVRGRSMIVCVFRWAWLRVEWYE